MLKRNKIRTIILTIAIAVSGVMSASPVFAQQQPGKKCGGADTSIITCSGEGQEAIIDILKLVIQIMTAGVGVLAIGAVAFGGVVYASSSGEPGKMKKAYEIWTNTAIGVLLFVFLVAITNFMIPGGVFGS